LPYHPKPSNLLRAFTKPALHHFTQPDRPHQLRHDLITEESASKVAVSLVFWVAQRFAAAIRGLSNAGFSH
jgi:hypothetical protein